MTVIRTPVFSKITKYFKIDVTLVRTRELYFIVCLRTNCILWTNEKFVDRMQFVRKNAIK